MFSFLKRKPANPQPQPVKHNRVNPIPRAGVLSPRSHLFETPAKLLDVAGQFHGQNLFDESVELAQTASLFLLRMRYLVAYQKLNTSCSDIEVLLHKLKQAEIISLGQFQHGRELYMEIKELTLKKRSRKVLQFGNYLLGILQPS